jgi:magnesium-protoporphyrin IX monomethyl ester (oxidative) cyclase
MQTTIRRVLLFMPPAITNKALIDINPAPPLGLGYIAAVLESMGKEVKIVDCLLEGWNTRVAVSKEIIRIGLKEEEIASIIREFRPDIVSVNSQFTRQYKNAHDIYRIAKAIDPAIITIAGGAHPSVLPEFAMQDSNLDYAVLGEGEEAIRELVDAIENDPSRIAKLDGVGYRDNGVVHVNRKTRFIEDLDTLPSPAWHLMNVEHYFGLEVSHGKRSCTRFFSIITSRGCPAKCVFCTAFNVWGRRYRARSAKKVVDEIKFLVRTYGIGELLIEDDNFTYDVTRAAEICDLVIAENLNVRFDTPNGIAAYKLTPALIDKMQRAGFERINLAIESGNQEALLKVIKKPLRLEKVQEIVEHCRVIGLEVGAFFIIGIPGTTLSQMWDNYRYCRKLKLFAPFISVATPYPGSELYRICKEKDYLSKDFNLEDLYIRKFSIVTERWGGFQLSLLMTAGWFYLKFFQMLDNPRQFAALLKDYIWMRLKIS